MSGAQAQVSLGTVFMWIIGVLLFLAVLITGAVFGLMRLCKVLDCGTGHRNRRWLNTDPCGLICGSITWGLLLYASYVVTFVVIDPWLSMYTASGLAHTIGFNLVVALGIFSHVKVRTHRGRGEEGKRGRRKTEDGRRKVEEEQQKEHEACGAREGFGRVHIVTQDAGDDAATYARSRSGGCALSYFHRPGYCR